MNLSVLKKVPEPELFSGRGTFIKPELCNTLNNDESIQQFWERCSEFYHLSFFAHPTELEKWIDTPKVYNILKWVMKKASWYTVDLVICKWENKNMDTYIVWYFGSGEWRTAKSVISELKRKFPEKFRELKHE